MPLKWSPLAIVAVATAAVAAPPAPQPLIDDVKLQAAGMTRFWSANLPLAAADSILAGHLVDDALYVTTTNGSLFAVVLAHSALNLAIVPYSGFVTVRGPIQEYGTVVLLWLLGIIVYVSGRKGRSQSVAKRN